MRNVNLFTCRKPRPRSPISMIHLCTYNSCIIITLVALFFDTRDLDELCLFCFEWQVLKFIRQDDKVYLRFQREYISL